MSVTGVALIALLSSACGSDTGVATPSDKSQIPVEVVTAEVTIGTESEKGRDLFVPEPTSTTERPAVVIETSEPLILSTTDDAENVSPLPTQVRREPTDTYTVHDLNTEPLVGSVFETLLAMMPDNEVTRAYTRMGDIAGVLDGLGLPRSISTGAFEEIIAVRNNPETDGFYPPFWQWPAEARDYVSIHDWYPDLAFEHGTVEQFAHSNSQFRFFGGGRQWTSYDVALGEFSASATSAAISACDCEQPEVRVYNGIDYYAWGDGTGIGQIQDRHKRPMFDHLVTIPKRVA